MFPMGRGSRRYPMVFPSLIACVRTVGSEWADIRLVLLDRRFMASAKNIIRRRKRATHDRSLEYITIVTDHHYWKRFDYIAAGQLLAEQSVFLPNLHV